MITRFEGLCRVGDGVKWSKVREVAVARERKKTDFSKSSQAGQQVSDLHQRKNRPAVLNSLQSAYLLKGQNRSSQQQASGAIMKSS